MTGFTVAGSALGVATLHIRCINRLSRTARDNLNTQTCISLPWKAQAGITCSGTHRDGFSKVKGSRIQSPSDDYTLDTLLFPGDELADVV